MGTSFASDNPNSSLIIGGTATDAAVFASSFRIIGAAQKPRLGWVKSGAGIAVSGVPGEAGLSLSKLSLPGLMSSRSLYSMSASRFSLAFYKTKKKKTILRHNVWPQCGPVVRAFALRSGDPGFKTRSHHSLNLFLVVPGSTS